VCNECYKCMKGVDYVVISCQKGGGRQEAQTRSKKEALEREFARDVTRKCQK
jgi:hypothetical protein